jgi:hypothetical protein
MHIPPSLNRLRTAPFSFLPHAHHMTQSNLPLVSSARHFPRNSMLLHDAERQIADS